MNAPRSSALALAAAATALFAAGCTTTFDSTNDKVDYKGAAAKTRPLEVPPDLSQLARDTRYQPQGGVISASGAPAAPGTAGAAASGTPAVAVAAQGAIRVERAGQQRWLVVPAAPEQLWPQVKSFWEQRGFNFATEDPQAGVLETNWNENRAKLPQDFIRGSIGRFLGGVYDSGERDRFRTRLERTAGGTEVYISHRGAEEVFADERRETTAWRMRPSDPDLEAQMLSRLMVALGGVKDEPAARAVVANAPETPARARLAMGGSVLEIDDPFDRAWRRVGLALDRGGFTVEDRDRTLGVYYVRYVDPRNAGKEEPGFWGRLFGDDSNPQAAIRYRIAVKGNGDKTVVAVLTSAGAADVGDNGKRIASLLVNELR